MELTSKVVIVNREIYNMLVLGDCVVNIDALLKWRIPYIALWNI